MTMAFSDLEFRDEWCWRSEDGVSYYKSGIIPGKVWYSKLSGTGDSSDIDALAPTMEAALVDGGFGSTPYIRVADYEKVSTVSITARVSYVKSLQRVQKMYDARPVVSYICGANFWARSAIKVFGATLSQKLVFVPNVEAAFAAINGSDDRFPVSDLSLGDMVFREEWQYVSPTTNYKCLMGVIPGSVVYYQREGVPDMDDVRWVVEELFQMVLLEGKMRGRKISFVWETLDNGRMPHEIRKYVYASIKALGRDFDAEILQMYVCGKRGFIYGLANVFSKGLNFKVHFVNTLDEALCQISDQNAEMLEPEDAAPIMVTDAHIEEINRLLGHLLMMDLDEREALPEVANDNPLYALKNSIDIAVADMTDLRTNDLRLNATLRNNLSLLTATLESTADGILVVNLEGRVTLRNSKFGRMWAVSEALLSSNDDQQIVDAILLQIKDPDAFMERIKMLYASPESKSFDILELKDGRVYERYSKPQVTEGRIVGRVWSYRDVTDRKSAELNLLESNRQLQIANDNAQELARQAQAANLAKSEFLANMSHEIRTPMNGVVGMIELLMDTTLTGDQLRYAEAARSSSAILLSVVNDILDISKIEAGKLEMESVQFSLKNVMNDFIATMTAKAEQKGLKLVSDYDARIPPFVIGDPRRLQQVLLNLIGNAIKFTTDGEVRVRVELSGYQDDIVELQFEVLDTGIGIEDNAVGRLFDKFSQADASTTRKFGGTGLGLAISKELVELMHGTISARRRESGGAAFCFSIEVQAHDPGVLDAAEVAGDRSGPSRTVNTDGVRVLLVEDNATNQLLAELMLKKIGFEVDIACDGIEALDALREQTFDVVLMDCQMPEMDGYEASRIIRAKDSAVLDPSVPIIALTANAMEGDRDRCLDAGMNDYIAKPLSKKAILETLKRWI